MTYKYTSSALIEMLKQIAEKGTLSEKDEALLKEFCDKDLINHLIKGMKAFLLKRPITLSDVMYLECDWRLRQLKRNELNNSSIWAAETARWWGHIPQDMAEALYNLHDDPNVVFLIFRNHEVF